MKTVRIHQTGGPEVLSYEDAPEPSPAPGQAVVEIKSIGVNYTDVLQPQGHQSARLVPLDPRPRGRRRGHCHRRGRHRGLGRRPRRLRHAHRHLLAGPLRTLVAAGEDPRRHGLRHRRRHHAAGHDRPFPRLRHRPPERRRPRPRPRRRRRHGFMAHPDAQKHWRLRPHHRLHRGEGRAGKGRGSRPHHHLHQAGFRGGNPQGCQRPGPQDDHGRRRCHHLRPEA